MVSKWWTNDEKNGEQVKELWTNGETAGKQNKNIEQPVKHDKQKVKNGN